MKEILFSFYRTKLIDISLLNNYISSNAIGSKIASSLQLNSESVLIGLMGGAILKFGLKKMPLPYTVGLFAFGLLIGTFDRIGWLESIPILKSSIDFAGNANPDMILYIFLPILIFDASGCRVDAKRWNRYCPFHAVFRSLYRYWCFGFSRSGLYNCINSSLLV